MKTSRAQTKARKAIIPAAGFGTRFLPITKTVPKEMLPLGDKPVIHYVVEEAVEAGLTDILIVISRGKESIMDYFARNPELERRLEETGKGELAKNLRALSERARIHYIYQQEMKGLGDAVFQGRAFAGNEPFAILLGDTVVTSSPGAECSPMRALLTAHESTETAVVAVERVFAEQVSRYGVVGGEQIDSRLFRLNALVEKPSPADAPRIRGNGESRAGPDGFYAIAARYVFTAGLFDELEKTAPGKHGEIQLTDAMQTLLRKDGFHAVQIQGVRHDIGNPAGLLKASQAMLQE